MSTSPDSNDEANHEERPGARLVEVPGVPRYEGDEREHGVAGDEGARAQQVDGAHLAQPVGQQAKQRREDHLAEGVGRHHEAVHGQGCRGIQLGLVKVRKRALILFFSNEPVSMIKRRSYPLQVGLQTSVYNGASQCQNEHCNMVDVEGPNPRIHLCKSVLFTFFSSPRMIPRN